MPDDADAVTVEVVPEIALVPAAAWDACAGSDNPFVSHAFLSALEESHSASAEEGWQPQHILLRDGAGDLIGAVPLYLKGHSYGEYVFDHGWAHAYERAGGRYYPKLQSSVPFTPATGPRLLTRPDAPTGTRDILIGGMEAVAEKHGVATAHVTFPREEEWAALGAAGWLQRQGQQYHWDNPGYSGFDDFLGELSSRKRKAIKKERRAVAEGPVRLRALTGSDLTESVWDAFFDFYIDTSGRKWGQPYLTRRFFSLIGERMADRIALIMGDIDGRYVCGALNLIGADTLYGRNWGAVVDLPFLHFEACYYQAMDFAIAHGLGRVEAGAQGTHKIQRGYLPNATYSAHLIRDPALHRAVANFLEHETEMVRFEMAALGEASPFRRG